MGGGGRFVEGTASGAAHEGRLAGAANPFRAKPALEKSPEFTLALPATTPTGDQPEQEQGPEQDGRIEKRQVGK